MSIKKTYLNHSAALFILISSVLVGCGESSLSVAKSKTTNDGQARCESWLGFKQNLDDFDTLEITSTQYITSVEQLDNEKDRLNSGNDFSPYCKLEGYFEKRLGANDTAYAIGIGLSLPDDWNGRFLFQGGGALNGLIRHPIGYRAAGETPALHRGFAVATTDSGHQSDSIFNHDFFADQQALLNFYSQAVYKSTVQAKQLITSFYQSSPHHNYFVGCSTGGREAMTMSQRYPYLFDGIIAGAPAMRTNLSEVADLYMARTLREVTGSGQQAPFTTEQQSAVQDALLEQCDNLDGLSDGLIMAVEQCQFKPQTLACSVNSSQANCLSDDQVKALQLAFAGPKDASGTAIYPGFYFDTGITATGKPGVPGILQAAAGPLGASRANEQFDLEREMNIAENFPLAAGNATLTNLSSFAQNGGKLMFFHGVSDPWFSAQDTLNYYTKMATDNGGLDTVSAWSQFYFVPGMGHCYGGQNTLDSFDMLSELVNWVEQKDKPAAVIAKGESMPDISRPLCPYPKVATYNLTGDPKLASSFDCKLPH